jgi:hypothetical protein
MFVGAFIASGNHVLNGICDALVNDAISINNMILIIMVIVILLNQYVCIIPIINILSPYLLVIIVIRDDVGELRLL